jgi:hypothetical protein
MGRVNPILMAKKKWIAVRLGVIYDSQATKSKEGGIPVVAPLPGRTPLGHKGVI